MAFYQPASFDNFVEIEIKLELPDHIQLFTITKDSISNWREKQSYWRRIKDTSTQTKVKWDLKDNEVFERFRIDVSTFQNHQIEINSIRMHVNRMDIFLRGKDIFDYFTPNQYLQLLECSNEFIKFRTINVTRANSPWLEFYKTSVDESKDLEYNARLAVKLNSEKPAILLCKIVDANGETKSAAQCYGPGQNSIEIKFNLSDRPETISIYPSNGSENRIELHKMTLNYQLKSISWDNKEIFDEFEWKYYDEVIHSNLTSVTTSSKAMSPFFISKTGVQFYIEKIMGLIIKIVMVIFSIIVFYFLNRFTLSKVLLHRIESTS